VVHSADMYAKDSSLPDSLSLESLQTTADQYNATSSERTVGESKKQMTQTQQKKDNSRKTVTDKSNPGKAAKITQTKSDKKTQPSNAQASQHLQQVLLPVQNDDAREQQLKTQLQDFMQNNENDLSASLAFPASLSSFERLCVHRLAEELGLEHRSTGQGTNRCVVVQLPQQPPQTITQASTTQSSAPEPTTPASPQTSNAPTHPPSSATQAAKKKKNYPPKPKKHPDNAKTKNEATKPSDDVDEILKELNITPNRCTLCKRSTVILGRICPFCKLKFCVEHAMPELHGCGDAAKQQARAEFRREFMKTQGSAEKPLNASQRHAARNRLEKKIEEAKKERSKKQGDDNTKK